MLSIYVKFRFKKLSTLAALDTSNSCNIGTSDLPDMYAQSPRATDPRAEGIHIRQITSAYVTTNM